VGGNQTLAMLARIKRAREKGYRFFIDSGAFTYQNKASTSPVPPPRRYFEDYKEFIIRYGHLFDVIAELDIDNAVKVDTAGNAVTADQDGRWMETPEVDEWTDELLAIKGIGHRVMPVFHAERGQRWLLSWLVDTRSPLLGYASANVVDAAAASKDIATAHRFGKWIHGFGVTRVRTDMAYTHFDSVDSSTWLRADRFGGTMLYDNDKLVVFDHLHKDRRREYKHWYQRHGIDFNLIAKDDLVANRYATLITWRDLSEALERKSTFRDKGRYPYLYEMWRDGNVPSIHPLVERAKQKT
jgi:hypothetical protein